jgi:hypothetical protein
MNQFLSLFLVFWFQLMAMNRCGRLEEFTKVAVCVGGQIDRWIPESQVPGLVEANKDVYFSFFFNLQYPDHRVSPSSAVSSDFEFGIPSNYTRLEFHRTLNVVSEMYTANNSEVVTMKFDLPYPARRWQNVMERQMQNLDRIVEYRHRPHLILNNYKNHVNCIDEIQTYENRTKITYDYILMVSEDLYYFHPMDLRPVFHALQKNAECGFISKGCLQNAGVSTRMQLARRADGLKIFGSKLAFYKWMFTSKRKTLSAESFELFQLQAYGYTNCSLPVDLFPVTGAKINSQGNICLMEKEVQSTGTTAGVKEEHSCIPKNSYASVEEIRCSPFKLKRPLF